MALLIHLSQIINQLSRVAEKWADSVVRVERHSERIMVLKMVLEDRLLNVFSVYAPYSGRPDEEKECFWNEVFHLVSCIPQNEMVVFCWGYEWACRK